MGLGLDCSSMVKGHCFVDHGKGRQAARTEKTLMVSLAASPGLCLSSGLRPKQDRGQQNIWICPRDVFI